MTTPDLLPLHIKVNVVDTDDRRNNILGTITGYGTLTADGTRPVYLVALNHGFYSPDKLAYIKVIVVHPDNVEDARVWCDEHSTHDCPFEGLD